MPKISFDVAVIGNGFANWIEVRLHPKHLVGPLVALALTSWLAEARFEMDGHRSPLEKASIGDLSFDGVRIGDGRSSVRQHWGQPSSIEPHGLAKYGGDEEKRYQIWRFPGARVVTFRDDSAVSLSIDAGEVTCFGRLLPGPGSSGEDVEATLGRPSPNEYDAENTIKVYRLDEQKGVLYYELETGAVQEVHVGL